jgi:uncharacterized protein (DUF1778 family)
MSARAALIISCSQQEAALIRQHADLQRRTISGYLLNHVMRVVAVQEKLFARFKTGPGVNLDYKPKSSGPRTTLLLRCSKIEAKRIRHAARTRQTTISAFVLYCVRQYWAIADELKQSIHFQAH